MADYRAISVATRSIVRLLEKNAGWADFGDHKLEFSVYLAKNFTEPMTTGVSLFLYRAVHNGAHRTPPGRASADGTRRHTQLPLDLHLFLTVWGKDAVLQHRILGWMMRVMEDYSILPSGLLGEVEPGVFHPDETIEIILAEMTNEDILRLWETLVPQSYYQLSIPYLIRMVRIESNLVKSSRPPVAEGHLKYAKHQ